MDKEQFVRGGQVSTITFGTTFVVIEGFTIKQAQTFQWWLRLDKVFAVRDAATSSSSSGSVDVVEEVLMGTGALIRCCGRDVVDLLIDGSGLSVSFAGDISLQMSWEMGEVSCAQIHVADVDEGNSNLVCMMTFPDDLSPAESPEENI